MFKGLYDLYKVYGGPFGLLRSPYFWVSAFLFLVSYGSAISGGWEKHTIGIMPSLTGFSIASFAIVFAVLKPEQVSVLLKKREGETAPLLRLFASITHAIIIQVSSILIAYVRTVSDLDWALSKTGTQLNCFAPLFEWLDWFTSSLGLFFTLYGIVLLLSLAIIIFQITKSVANSIK
jgi:hypothetical protein